jgi:hypothetical protein
MNHFSGHGYPRVFTIVQKEVVALVILDTTTDPEFQYFDALSTIMSMHRNCGHMLADADQDRYRGLLATS